MTRIVVLDGHTLNPGDLSWEGLHALGECTVYPRTSPGAVIERAAGATIILTNKVPLDAATLRQLPDLKFIGVLATGYNVIDVEAARARGIVVANVPGYGTPAVAQHVMALLLALTNRVEAHSQSVFEGEWSRSPDFCYWKTPLVELQGLTLGLVGLGAIGTAVARLGIALGMQVKAYTRRPFDCPGVSRIDTLPALAAEADVISLHCPLTAETQGMINATFLAAMKPTAYLVNTGRGPLVVEHDLAVALKEGRLAGAALDVLSTEPPATDNPLLHAPNCIITPHIAWATRAARERLLAQVIANIRAFLQGSPVNQVN